jgi:hypothetical protein
MTEWWKEQQCRYLGGVFRESSLFISSSKENIKVNEFIN